MMRKMLVILMALLVVAGSCAPAALAADEPEFQLTIDVNERYTDISETIEGEDVFGYRQKEQKEKETKRNTFIAVMVAALVIAVVILVISLKRVPDEENIKIGKPETEKTDKKE